MRRAALILALALGWWSSVYPADVKPCRWGADPFCLGCPPEPGVKVATLPDDQVIGMLSKSGKTVTCLAEKGTQVYVYPDGSMKYAICGNPPVYPLPRFATGWLGEDTAEPAEGEFDFPCPPCDPFKRSDCPSSHPVAIYYDPPAEDLGWCKRKPKWCTAAKIGGGALVGLGVGLIIGNDHGGGGDDEGYD